MEIKSGAVLTIVTVIAVLALLGSVVTIISINVLFPSANLELDLKTILAIAWIKILLHSLFNKLK